MPGDWIEEKRRKHLQDILQDDRMPKRQRETLQELERRWRLDGQTVTTRQNKASMARRIGKFLDKPFEDATREDIETYLANKSENVAQATLNSYKRFIKAFFKDLHAPEAEDHPPVVSWINLKNPLKATKTPNDLVTPDEILEMAEAATQPRDRALTMVLYESAARLGEVLNAQIRDVAFDQYGARLHLKGKTGERKVRLLRSVPDLRTWLNHHPRRDDPDAPLFVSYAAQNRHAALRLNAARKIVKRNSRDARLVAGGPASEYPPRSDYPEKS